MKIYTEKSLRNFEFWSGGQDRAKLLTFEELDTIEQVLEEINPGGMDATDINDLFWFEFEMIAEWLGTTEEEIFERE